MNGLNTEIRQIMNGLEARLNVWTLLWGKKQERESSETILYRWEKN